MPCRSPYRPVLVVRMSSAVCAISGVWLLDRKVPLSSKKLRRFGIICRSEGTLGLSRRKCTLSKVIWTTCWMPLPRWHDDALLSASVVSFVGLARWAGACGAANEVPARPRVHSAAAEAVAAVTRNHVVWRARPLDRLLIERPP